jgi:hypothetical protein
MVVGAAAYIASVRGGPDYVRALEKELDTNLGKYEAFVKTL